METRPFGPQRSAAQPREVPCAGQRWLQGLASSGWWGTVAVLASCTCEEDQLRSVAQIQTHTAGALKPCSLQPVTLFGQVMPSHLFVLPSSRQETGIVAPTGWRLLGTA
jgi:hypothetical protein